MGVCIWKCNKNQDNIIKDSSIDCYKKTDQSFFPNIITSNNIANEENNNKMIKLKYNKLFNDNTKDKAKLNQQNNNNNQNINYTFSNKGTNSNSTKNENYVKNVVKIQSLYRKHSRMKKEKEKDKIEIIKKKEDSLFLKLNLEMTETVFSSNSFHNSNYSKDNEDNNGGYKIIENNSDNESYKEEDNILIPFNIKTKMSNMHYKYSGYVKKKIKVVLENSPKNDNSNSFDEKEIFDNEGKSSLIKEGFGKFIFKDGTEFCGIFHNNTIKNYGKYSNINQRNNEKNNEIKEVEKEILITDNINYEDFVGIYKNYIPDGFGIYNNLITNLKITGIFGNKGIYGIGIEHSEEGGYIYEGEFNNNKKEGLGTIFWKDGCIYKGEFKNNQMNGYGMIEFSGNNFYQGEIRNGKMEGFGEFLWNDKRKYIGNYKNDKRNGFGIYMSKINELQNCSENENEYETYNSSFFVGFWKNGNMDGFGMKIVNSEIKYGIWENGFKKKYIENNLALKTYGKWIDKKYKKLFFATKQNILDFFEDIFNTNI